MEYTKEELELAKKWWNDNNDSANIVYPDLFIEGIRFARGLVKPIIGANEVELRQAFKNQSDCYADTRKLKDDRTMGEDDFEEGEVIQAMTEDRFIEVLKQAKLITETVPKISIDDLDISIRCYQVLKRKIGYDFRQITLRTREDFMTDASVSRKTIQEIEELMQAHGLDWRVTF